MPQAFARHQIVTGEDGKPIDYIFLEVNATFEKMTGLSRDNIVGKKVTEVLPEIEKGDFDWIGVYGKVALEAETISFEQYSETLGRWYDVTAYSDEPDHFITVFTEITARKEELVSMKSLLQMTEKLVNIRLVNLNYQEIAEALKKFSGADYVVINTCEKGCTKSVTRAIAGISSALSRVSEILGFDLTGHAWEIIPERLSYIEGGKLIHFPGLYETSAGALNKSTALLLEKTFKIGDIYVINLAFGESPSLGDIAFFMPRNRTIQKREAIELYAAQIGSLLARVQAEKELDIINRQYEDVVTTMKELLCRYKLDTTLTFANKACRQYFNLTDEDIGHKKFLDLVPEKEHEGIRKHLQTVSKTMEPETYEYAVFASNQEKWQSWTNYPLADENGAVTEFQSYGWDITDRKQAEEALKASEEKYREILSAIEEGYYETDLDGNFIFFNDSFCGMSGYSRSELMQESYKKLHRIPQEIFATYNRVYRTGISEKAADWPLITKDGREIFIELSITLRRDETGSPIGFRGIVRDITERRLAEEKLHEYEKLQQLLMNLATESINVPLEKVDQAINDMLKTVGEFTKVDRVYIFNHDYNRRVTSNTHEWCAEGIPPEIDNLQDFPFERFPDFLEANQKGEIINIPDVAQMPANHAMCPVFEAQGIQSVIMLPLFSEGVNTGFVGFDAVKQKKAFTEQEITLLKVLAEITSNLLARQETETNIHYMSFHDQLTGLYNRYFLEEEMVRLNTKRQLPLAVIMADLNGLKLVNDTYGHDTGDEMLKTVANIIRNSCREEDVIARWGGDEFVVLLPQTAAEEARLIGKRISEGCQNSFVGNMPVSIALGIANKTFKAKGFVKTLCEAEDEMYKQKLTESRSTKSAMVAALLNTLADKSFETEEHTRGMQKIAQKIGANLNLTDNELRRLELLITLHDIGKINIAEEILTKNDSLTADEWEEIKKHPEIGCRIAMATEQFSHVAEDILAHHERWDGTGYPQGLKGNGISLLARIVAIADAYEVMSNGRPYKKAMSENEIIDEFRRCSGAQFDPELVEIFLSVLKADC